MNPASAERNEQNVVTVRGEGFEVTFKQIAGLLARRIVFNHARGRRGGTRTARGADQVRLPGGRGDAGGGRVAGEGGRAGEGRRRACWRRCRAEPQTVNQESFRRSGAGQSRARRGCSAACSCCRRCLPSVNIGAGYFSITQTIEAISGNARCASTWTGRRSRFCLRFPLTRWTGALRA